MGVLDNMVHLALRGSKLRSIEATLARNKFVNEDIGPIGKIATVDKFVISMPKVASTAIQRGFLKLGQDVIHAHNNPTTYDAFPNSDKLRDAGITLERLCQYRDEVNPDPMFFFFGYREPVSWYLSMASQFSLPLDEKLKENILTNISRERPWMKYKFRESQKVVESATGIRLLDGKFDHASGLSVIKRGKISVILYRFDRLHELSQYTRSNIEPRFELNLERINENSAYKAYCQSFRLYRDTLEKLYANPVFSFFYTAEEATRFVEKYAAD